MDLISNWVTCAPLLGQTIKIHISKPKIGNTENEISKIEIGTRGCLKSKVLNRNMEIGKIDAKIIIEATQTKWKIVTALVRGHK